MALMSLFEGPEQRCRRRAWTRGHRRDALGGPRASRASREQWGAAAQHGELSAVLCVGERGPRGVAGGGSRGRRCMYTRG